MTYYKLICGTEFIGVATQIDLRKYQKKHNILLSCDEQAAQYIEFEGFFYHSSWMTPITVDKIDYRIADVIEIDQSEYLVLKESKEISTSPSLEEDNEEDNTEENTGVPIEEEITLEYVKEKKIESLNQACRKEITSGIDVEFEDGNSSHFSLTTQDQLNIITLKELSNSGEKNLSYHADGEPCRYFTEDEIGLLYAKMINHKTYHTTYFNSLRQYVLAQKTIEKVSAIEYGITIPKKYRTDVLNTIMSESES